MSINLGIMTSQALTPQGILVSLVIAAKNGGKPKNFAIFGRSPRPELLVRIKVCDFNIHKVYCRRIVG